MVAESLLRIHRAGILRLAAHRGVRDVRIFGSFARGDQNEASDLDFPVALEPGRSLLDLGGFLMDVRELLGRDVDVTTPGGLHWYIRDRILSEAVPL